MIVMGKIESGCCRVGDRCLIMPHRTRVEITNIYYEENETDSSVCGENRVHRGNSDQKFKISFYFSSLFCISRDRELIFRP